MSSEKLRLYFSSTFIYIANTSLKTNIFSRMLEKRIHETGSKENIENYRAVTIQAEIP